MKKEFSLIEQNLHKYAEEWATEVEKENIYSTLKRIEHKTSENIGSDLNYIKNVLLSYYDDCISTNLDLQKRLNKSLKTLERKLLKSDHDEEE